MEHGLTSIQYAEVRVQKVPPDSPFVIATMALDISMHQTYKGKKKRQCFFTSEQEGVVDLGGLQVMQNRTGFVEYTIVTCLTNEVIIPSMWNY